MKTTGPIPYLLSWYVLVCFSITSTLALENYNRFTEMQAKPSYHLDWPALWEDWQQGGGEPILCMFLQRLRREGHWITPPTGMLKYQLAVFVGNTGMYDSPISFKKLFTNIVIPSFPVPSNPSKRASVKCWNS